MSEIARDLAQELKPINQRPFPAVLFSTDPDFEEKAAEANKEGRRLVIFEMIGGGGEQDCG